MNIASGQGRSSHLRPSRRVTREIKLAVNDLEGRVLLSTADLVTPTPNEQYMLELINRARSNPPAEGQRLLAEWQSDPALQAATVGWNVPQVAKWLSNQMPLPPLAFNTRLIAAARRQDVSMLAANNQFPAPAGFLTNPAVAVDTDGQPYYLVGQSPFVTGENVAAYSQAAGPLSVTGYLDFLHAAFMIDWGNPSFTQMLNLTAPGPDEAIAGGHVPFNEVGIGVLSGVAPTVAAPLNGTGHGQNVGPTIVSQEFGWRSGAAFLTGVAYQDLDANGFYTPGEGLAGVKVTAVGLSGQGTFQATTWSSGGYSLQLPPGQYMVSATGNLPYIQQTNITMGQDNNGFDIVTKFAVPQDMPIAANYTGDGHDYPSTFRSYTGQWFTSDARFSQTIQQFGQPSLDTPVPGNYDGTGKAELAVYRSSTAQWLIQGPTGTRVVPFGMPGVDIPVPGDYDGDGRTDLAVYRPTTAQWFVLGSSSGAHFYQFGAPGVDVPVPGDYDGSGHLQLAVFRPTTDQWFISSPKGNRFLQFGQAGADLPVPGDYDGDGRTDVAVYRPGSAQWFVRASTAGPFFVGFGQPGLDQPVPSAYDGGKRTEIAVYRPSTAEWFILGAGGPRKLQIGQGGFVTPLTASSGAVVSLGGHTQRFIGVSPFVGATQSIPTTQVTINSAISASALSAANSVAATPPAQQTPSPFATRRSTR